ncbi:MAG: hypothetical protein KC621_03865 [Myxococcales bacterium]|nr:hypothetical protein [Myxococcales bacterium]
MRSENLEPASNAHPPLEELVPIEPTSETDQDATMEAPHPALVAVSTGVPAWAFPVVAALSAAAGWIASSLHPVATAPVGWLLGTVVAVTLRRWSGGLLLAASSWVIGGIAAGSVLTFESARGGAAFTDAGLVGMALVALAAPGEREEAGAWWIWPARALIVVGVLQALTRLV